MDSLQINTGEKRIPIVRDGENVGTITFNPSDAVFAEAFYKIYGELKVKHEEYKKRAAEFEDATDESGLPVNPEKRLAMWQEFNTFIKGCIDRVFGVGTSQIVFGDTISMDGLMFEQFLNGVTPYVQKERSQKIAQYTTPASAKRNKARK